MQFFGYKKCGTCRKAEKFLDEHNIEYKFIDITEQAPSVAQLKKILKQDGMEMKKLFNTSGVMYRELGMKDKLSQMTEAEALELLSKNGKLVKRPIAIHGNHSTVGFKQETFEKVWL